jgi:hypothetical protein
VDVSKSLIHFPAGKIQSAGETNGESDRLGAGSASVLLMSAPCTRPQLHAAPLQQSANAFGSMKLVGAKCQRIDAEVVEMYGDLSHGLCRIAVGTGAAGDRLGLGADRLNRSHFMVGQHDRDETRIGAQAIH